MTLLALYTISSRLPAGTESISRPQNRCTPGRTPPPACPRFPFPHFPPRPAERKLRCQRRNRSVEVISLSTTTKARRPLHRLTTCSLRRLPSRLSQKDCQKDRQE